MENDLISRNTLVAAIQEYQMNLFHNKLRLGEIDLNSASALANVERIVCEAPAIEAEPVRHGRWVLETNSGYRDSYFEDYILVVSITAKCSECGENYGRTGHVYGDEFMGEEDGARPVENVEEKIEQTRNKYLDWLRSGRCKLMNYCPNCGAKMDGGAE